MIRTNILLFFKVLQVADLINPWLNLETGIIRVVEKLALPQITQILLIKDLLSMLAHFLPRIYFKGQDL